MPDYTVERFVHGIGDVLLKDALLRALASGYQLTADAIPDQALPPVLMLAAYAKYYEDVDLVDDYELLVEAQREAFRSSGNCAHPDLFFASCICILDAQGMFPSKAAFQDIGVPAIFEELTAVEEE